MQEDKSLNQKDVNEVFGDEEPKVPLKGVELLIDKATAFHVRLPMLEVVYDRLMRTFATTLRNFSGANTDVEVDKVQPQRFADFSDKITIPSIIAVVKAVEWDNYMMVVVENKLTYGFVDILFGGRRNSSEGAIIDRPFTSIEQNISQTVVELLLHDLESCFETVTPVSLHMDRIEVNPRFAVIARPEDVGICATISLSIEGRAGNIDIFAPFATLEPVKKILAKSFIGEKGNKDPLWVRHFQSEISNTKVTVEAFLNGKTSTIRNILNIKVGDTIVLDTLADDDLILKVGDLQVSSGKLGKVNGKMAIKLNDGLSTKVLEG